MIRRFNYTGRRKLPKSCARVYLYRTPDSPSEFQAELHLDGQHLPDDAQVYVEAYYRSSMMRFPFGTVADAVEYAGERYTLNDIQNTLAFFRVKVVDESADFGRIIGIIDQIKPSLPDEADAPDTSLLFVQYVDLGNRIWRIDIADDHAMPILQVNSELNIGTSVQEFVRYDPAFMSLVFPSAVREILDFIVRDEGLPESDEEGWKADWLQFGTLLTGERALPDFFSMSHEERAGWVDDAVNAFCEHNELKAKLEQGFGME